MTSIALLTWLSPSFPVGAFAYSGGLEAAVARGAITDTDGLVDWLHASLAGGTIRADTLAAALAARGIRIDDLVLALTGCPTREAELTELGAAFVIAADPWWPNGLDAPITYPVAVGTLAGAHRIDGAPLAVAFALAATTNAVGAAQRLLPIGQREGVGVVAALQPAIERLAIEATRATEDELFTCTPVADICALAHPTIEPRLFRS